MSAAACRVATVIRTDIAIIAGQRVTRAGAALAAVIDSAGVAVITGHGGRLRRHHALVEGRCIGDALILQAGCIAGDIAGHNGARFDDTQLINAGQVPVAGRPVLILQTLRIKARWTRTTRGSCAREAATTGA